MEYKGVTFTAYDIGGKDKLRLLWRYYYQNTTALIFVVDANDRDCLWVIRMPLQQVKFQKILQEDELKGKPVLVLANKQELPNPQSAEEVEKRLQLEKFMDGPLRIQGCSAISRDRRYLRGSRLAQRNQRCSKRRKTC